MTFKIVGRLGAAAVCAVSLTGLAKLRISERTSVEGNMRKVGFVSCLIAAAWASAFQALALEPIRAQSSKVVVIADAGDKPINVMAGITPLDKLHPFTCKSARGCLVVMSLNVDEQGDVNEFTCPQIDEGSVPMKPNCVLDNGSPIIRRYIAEVAQGSHTVRTVVQSTLTLGQVLDWEVDYSIYERGNPSN